MTFSARFVIPTVSAEKLKIDLARSYPVSVVSNTDYADANRGNFVNIYCDDFDHPFLMQINQTQFFEDRVVLRGWINYVSESPYLFNGIVELRNNEVLSSSKNV